MSKLTIPQQKWVNALRSGQYTKTKGLLTETNPYTGQKSYCCLGVLCEVAIQEKVIADYDVERPLQKVCNWVGLQDFQAAISKLITLNDRLDKTFTEIADIIERDESLFVTNTEE